MNIQDATDYELIEELCSRTQYTGLVCIYQDHNFRTHLEMSGPSQDRVEELIKLVPEMFADAVSDRPTGYTSRKIINGIDYMSDEALFQP